MKQILGIRFKNINTLCYYKNNDEKIEVNDQVVAETDKGLEVGRVVKVLNEDDLKKEEKEKIKDILRKVTKEDLNTLKENDKMAKEAFLFCKEKIKELNLSMKLILAEYTLDATKLTFYFVSEERVDFRELVKLLASKYKVRIELRQIGQRDEVRVYPNLGMCGREVCCRTFLHEFEPVTIKMAKEQGLQINMSKLSGACGKLMCCLRYEEEAYKENLKKLPKVGEMVTVKETEEEGKVTALDILKLKVKVKFGTSREDERFEVYDVNEISFKERK